MQSAPHRLCGAALAGQAAPPGHHYGPLGLPGVSPSRRHRYVSRCCAITANDWYSAAGLKVMYVVGARPNFVKMAPVISEVRRALPDGQHVVVHTGQHYDRMMSSAFIDELRVPAPDYVLQVGSATHAVQTARVMERIEAVIDAERPDLVLVPGDVNSTLAATLVAAKLGVPLGHVEAGLRSFDRTMPEEIDRIVADEFSDYLFIHSDEGAIRGDPPHALSATGRRLHRAHASPRADRRDRRPRSGQLHRAPHRDRLSIAHVRGRRDDRSRGNDDPGGDVDGDSDVDHVRREDPRGRPVA